MFCPILVLGSLQLNKIAYANIGDNMSCFNQPDEVISAGNLRLMSYLIVIIYGLHDKRRTEVTQFLQNEISTEQQDCLQKVFDTQPDGIIILSKRIRPPKPKR